MRQLASNEQAARPPTQCPERQDDTAMTAEPSRRVPGSVRDASAQLTGSPVLLTAKMVVDAVAAGHDTSSKIARKLQTTSVKVNDMLMKLRDAGRIYSVGVVRREGRTGRPPLRWRVNLDWVRPARVQSEAVRAKIAATVSRHWQDGDYRLRRAAGVQARNEHKGVAIPPEVLVQHGYTYREIARVLGEETALSWAREAKRLVGVSK